MHLSITWKGTVSLLPDSEHSDYSTHELQLLSGICYVYYAFTPCLQHTTSNSNSGIPSLTLGYVCTEVPIIPASWPCMPPGGYKKLKVCPRQTCFTGNPSFKRALGMQMPAQLHTMTDTFHTGLLHLHHCI